MAQYMNINDLFLLSGISLCDSIASNSVKNICLQIFSILDGNISW